jgi:hypothetical protein
MPLFGQESFPMHGRCFCLSTTAWRWEEVLGSSSGLGENPNVIPMAGFHNFQSFFKMLLRRTNFSYKISISNYFTISIVVFAAS